MDLFVKLHKYLFFSLIFLIPSGIYNLEGLIIALLFANWLWLKKFNRIKVIPLGNIFLIVFFLMILISYLFFSFTRSFAGILQYISFLLIPLVLVGFEIKNSDIRTGQIIFIISSLIFVFIADVYCIIDIVLTGETTIFIEPNIFNKYSYYGLTRLFSNWHPTYVSLFLNVSLLLLLKIYSNQKIDLKFHVAVIVIVVNIFLLNSLIGVLSLFIFPLLFFICLRPNKRQIFFLMTLLALFSIIITTNPLKIDKISRLTKTGFKLTDVEEETNSFTIRLVKWKTAIDVFVENPIVGVGMNNVKEEMGEKYLENNYLNCARYKYSPHNQYLFFAVALGSVGVLFYLAILGIGFYKCATILEKSILIMFMLFCFTEEILSRQQGLIFFALFYSFINSNHVAKIETT